MSKRPRKEPRTAPLYQRLAPVLLHVLREARRPLTIAELWGALGVGRPLKRTVYEAAQWLVRTGQATKGAKRAVIPTSIGGRAERDITTVETNRSEAA